MQRIERLRKQKIKIGRTDLGIASMVLEHGATLVTENARDPLDEWPTVVRALFVQLQQDTPSNLVGSSCNASLSTRSKAS
jgi:hypothetical protein